MLQTQAYIIIVTIFFAVIEPLALAAFLAASMGVGKGRRGKGDDCYVGKRRRSRWQWLRRFRLRRFRLRFG